MNLEEELSQPLKDIINNPNIQARNKHASMAKLLKTMLTKGMETGLQDAKPKKGSSRAVYFPSEPDDITIDGTPSKMHSVLKIAFPGKLDKYTGEDELLGEHQNRKEAEQYTQNQYGMLRQKADGTYETNHNGILAPVIHAHEDGHYLHMGKIDPIKAGEFRELTKTPEFPKGISHDEFHNAVQHEYAESQGRHHYSKYSDEQIERLLDHPLVEKALNFSRDTETQPIDFVKGNMGIWTHPVTGQKHIVLSDYGYDRELMGKYHKAWNNQIKKRRGY